MVHQACTTATTRFSLLDHSPIGHFVLNRDFTVLFWNKCLEAWTEISKEQIIGKDITEYFPHLRGKKYASRIRSMFAGGPPTIFSSQLHNFVIPAPLPGGKYRFQYTVVTAVPEESDLEESGDTSRHGGFYALFSIQDVTSLTEAIGNHRIAFEKAQEEMSGRRKVEGKLIKYMEELQRLNRALREKSIRDGLTGLFNHRHFYSLLRRYFLLTTRNDGDLTCLLLDLDHFKEVNDRHGHQFGDEVLKSVAARIRKTVRETDVVSRYGGEEFAVLLPGTDIRGAIVTAEKIRTMIGTQKFENNSIAVHVTVSIGIATCGEHCPDRPEVLLNLADTALYQAKAAGRNCVRSYAPPSTAPSPPEYEL